MNCTGAREVHRCVHSSTRRCAFTLLELLVVIAVVALLAATVLPALAKTNQRSRLLTCQNNFRQVGSGLRMYAEDSSDWLPPGPVPLGSGSVDALQATEDPAYMNTQGSQKCLAHWIASYCGQAKPTDLHPNNWTLLKTLYCPGYAAATPDGYSGAVYYPEPDLFQHAFSLSATRQTNNPANEPEYHLAGFPFGKAGVQNSLKLSALSASAPMNSVWAVADIDTNCFNNPTVTGSALPYLLRNPAHGEVRSFLYFDWHVATKPVTSPDNY